jgi:hypothetical protein
LGILDDLAQAGAGFTRQFGGLGAEVVWAQLRPWFSSISTHGVLRWLPRAAVHLPCHVPEYEGGVPVGPCRHAALETCLACGEPVCLTHAFVDSHGEAICYLCAVKLRAVGSGADSASPGPQADSEQERQRARRQAAEQRAGWARGVLNVQEGISWEDVRRQHRKLSARLHPDRAGGDEARYKNVQMAYDVLKEIYGEK